MLKSIIVASFLLLYSSSAFAQELLEDKKTGKFYYKQKNPAGEWEIIEYQAKLPPPSTRSDKPSEIKILGQFDWQPLQKSETALGEQNEDTTIKLKKVEEKNREVEEQKPVEQKRLTEQNNKSSMNFFSMLILLVLFIMFYFLPSIIAAHKDKMNQTAIFALNLLLGWTVIGWVAALVWSLTEDAQTLKRIEEKAASGKSSWITCFCLIFLLSSSVPIFARGGGGRAGGGHSTGSHPTPRAHTAPAPKTETKGAVLRPFEGLTAPRGIEGKPRQRTAGDHPKTYCKDCTRDNEGQIKRSSSEREKFLKSKGLTHTPKGMQVDHIVPLSKGGADKVSNMQLIPKDSPKEKNELK